jgi:predicted TIM-barrel fold metal-dependent hydrolase
VNHENLYFGLSLVVEPGFIETIAERIGPDKLIYGSNATGGIPNIGVKVFDYTGLSESEKEMAIGKNLMNLLKL